MKEHYVSYEQGQALKMLGFAEKVNHGYSRKLRIEPALSYGDVKEVHSKDPKNFNDNRKGAEKGLFFCSAPRLDQAQAWMRDCKGIAVCVFPERYNEDIVQGIYRERLCGWDFEIWNLKEEEEYDIPNIGYRESYESALSVGIDKAIELLGKKVKE